MREKAKIGHHRGKLDQFIYDLPGESAGWLDEEEEEEEKKPKMEDIRVTRLKARTPQKYGLEQDR